MENYELLQQTEAFQTETTGAPELPPTRKKKGKLWQNNWQYLLMCLPMVAKILLFSIVPLVWLLMAFQDYDPFDGLLGSTWIWFDNFRYFFEMQDVWRVTANTLGLNIMFIAVGTPITIAMALFMYEMKNRFATKLFQTIYFAPYLISWVIVQHATNAILNNNGLINTLLVELGLDKIEFFATKNAGMWPLILLLCNFWKNTGYSLIMYYSALGSLDTCLLEAAELDGANKLQKMWHVSLPHLSKVAAILLIMSMGGIFRSDFGLFWFIPKNETHKTLLSTTEVLDTYIYALTRLEPDLPVATAIGLIQSIVGTITLLITNAVVKKIDAESAYI